MARLALVRFRNQAALLLHREIDARETNLLRGEDHFLHQHVGHTEIGLNH